MVEQWCDSGGGIDGLQGVLHGSGLHQLASSLQGVQIQDVCLGVQASVAKITHRVDVSSSSGLGSTPHTALYYIVVKG